MKGIFRLRNVILNWWKLQTEAVTISHSVGKNCVHLLLGTSLRFVDKNVWGKDFFPEYYIPSFFSHITASSTTPLYTTQARYMLPRNMSANSERRHLQATLLPTCGAVKCEYVWFIKSSCDDVWYFVALSCCVCSIGPQNWAIFILVQSQGHRLQFIT